MEKLSVVQVWELVQRNEALVVDLRGPSEFSHGHVKGALSLPYSEKGLKDRLSGLCQSGSPVIPLSDAPNEVAGAVAQFQDSAFSVVGVADGIMGAWYASGLPVGSLAEVSVHQLAEDNAQGNSRVVLDVREPIEWEMGHVPGALLISLNTLRERLHEIPSASHIAVICEAGVRSSSAASILQAEGFYMVANVPEGTGGYRRAGLPLEFTQENGGNARNS